MNDAMALTNGNGMTTIPPKSPIFNFNEKLSLNDNISYDQQLSHQSICKRMFSFYYCLNAEN